MAARPTMAALILRVRDLINDTLPPGSGQVWTDDQIQAVMDESRVDYKNLPLKAQPTFTSGTIQYLDYWSDLGGWEDGYVLKQYLITTVTPSTLEPIAGHWVFTLSTYPPVYISGSLHDVYRASADLLERWSAKYALRFDFSSDGQSFHLSQASTQLHALAKTYRMQQRATSIITRRSDANEAGADPVPGLEATPVDYMASG